MPRCAAARHVLVMDGANEVPNPKCTCGIFATKNLERPRQLGYASYGVSGEVYLWGTVVEHTLGWRAQFAYPKSLFLLPDAIPFALTEIDARLKTLIAFGTDIFILGEHESICFWKNGEGFDAAGLDYVIKTRKEYYVRRQRERTLKKGDRVAVLGRGIAVVEQVDDREVVALLNRTALKIARKDIALNQQNMRWEVEASAPVAGRGES
jgi:preprotein translocase subunit YajC